MKNKNITKIIAIFILLNLFISCMPTIVSASFSIKEAIDNAKDFPGTGNNIQPSKEKDLQATIYNILFTVGIIVAVIGTSILGIQFITSAPEGRAEVKQRMIPFVIGCIIVFAGFTIWKFAVNLVQGISI